MIMVDWQPVFKRIPDPKTRLYLFKDGQHYEFCWLSFLKKDGALSFGLDHKHLVVTELGSALRVDAKFVDHFPTLKRSAIVADNIKDLHITLHPPRITQKAGIAHIRSGSETIGRWPLDWFPVKKAQCLIHFYSGEISRLRQAQPLKQNGLTIPVNSRYHFIRMDVIMFPRKPDFSAKVRPHVDIVGHTPHYIIVCRINPSQVREAGLYVATDQWKSNRLNVP